MSGSNQARELQLLSLCYSAQEPQLLSPPSTSTEAAALEPLLCNKKSHRNGTVHRSWRVAPSHQN